MNATNYFDPSILKKHIISLMPPKPINYWVSKEQQEKKLAELRANQDSKNFFFVVNLETYEIEYQCRINKWLGYNEAGFTMIRYLNILEKGSQKSLITVGLQIYNILCKGKIVMNMNMRFSSLLAIKHYNGHYLLVQKISMPFQYDENNCMTAHINLFYVISRFKKHFSLEPEFFNVNGNSEEERAYEIREKIKEFLKKNLSFSPNETTVSRCIAENENLDYQRISQKVFQQNKNPITQADFNKYCERIKSKCNSFFELDFKNSLDAVLHLKSLGMFT